MAGYYDEDVLRELKESEDNYEYYTLLNVDKNADQEQVRKAYHRLCRLYHPDRYQDEDKQKTATELFRNIQEAYKILSDPRTRAMYDKRGRAGLNDDLALVERSSLPTELLEEYEKLRELWEERTYVQDCHPGGDFRMAVNATPLFDGTRHYGQGLFSVESFQIQQSVDAVLTKSAFAQVTGILSTQQRQKLFGGIQFALRQVYANQNWVKVTALVGSTPVLGVEAYHIIGDRMYVQGHSTLGLSNGGLALGMNASVTRRLNESTSGTISLRNIVTGGTASVILNHQVSPTTSMIGEVSVSQEESFVKGIVIYQPIPLYSLKAGVQTGTGGFNVLYGIEHDVAKLTNIGFTVMAGPTQGVALKLQLRRASMNFQLKLRISDYVGASSLLYASVIPLLLYSCIKVLAVGPILRKEWLQEVKERKSERVKEVMEKKKIAEAAVKLMQETVQRVVNIEQAKHGLLISEAWYGKLIDHQSNNELAEAKVIDVHIPLQCLVMDSKLVLRESSKANISGFYDPCIGEKKYLQVRYEFRGLPHEVTIENSEPLVIPRASHRVVNLTE